MRNLKVWSPDCSLCIGCDLWKCAHHVTRSTCTFLEVPCHSLWLSSTQGNNLTHKWRRAMIFRRMILIHSHGIKMTWKANHSHELLIVKIYLPAYFITELHPSHNASRHRHSRSNQRRQGVLSHTQVFESIPVLVSCQPLKDGSPLRLISNLQSLSWDKQQVLTFVHRSN